MANEVNSINYIGNVTIKYVTKSGRPVKSIYRHNKGCRPLFNFITSCMMGKYNENNRPVYLMVYKKGEEVTSENLGTPVLPNLQYILNTESSYDSENDAGIVKYKFMFPGSVLTNDGDVIALFNYNNANTYKIEGANVPSNYVELTGADIINQSDVINQNVIVIWELQFSNKAE